MTGEEMERAIEFLLQSQANLEAQQRRTDGQIAETGRQLQAYAQIQSEFIRATTESITRLAEAQERTDARLAKTDERLNKLIGLFEQHIIAGH
jgi:septal ring factor EnvC (AmiA/AmiB activator)